MQVLILFGVLISTYLMVIAKRMPALIRSFRYQSFFLFLATFAIALKEHELELYTIAGMLLIIKVLAIPHFLYRIIRRIRPNEDLGLFINTQLSLFSALALTCLSWIFTTRLIMAHNQSQALILAVSFSVVLTGMFLMMTRMTALAQIIGLLVMENGLFLLASAVSGGMPFFVETAIFLDVFVSVIIMGIFVYRINKLFTHIDVNKLSGLKG
jgi:hydrogenase-4 component E